MTMTTNTQNRPDIIYIVADDLGSADLGCYGGDPAVSPAIDRLAAEGLRFTTAYANSPVCSPTRFALITGRWQYRLRGAAEEPLGRRSDTLGLPPEHPTLPSLLRDAGYATALAGKWHLGYAPAFGPLKSGYQEFFGPMGGAVDYFSYLNFGGQRDLWDGAAPSAAEGYLTDLVSERAAAFVARDRGAQPYFLSVHYTAPHWPWEDREGGRRESQRIGADIGHLDGGSIEVYRRMIRQMDEGIARILAAIPAPRRADTLVVFTSDNGPVVDDGYQDEAVAKLGEHRPAGPLRGGKGTAFEGGTREPFIVRWPKHVPAGKTSGALVGQIDLLASLAALTGQKLPNQAAPDSVDVLPALLGESEKGRKTLVEQGRNIALRQDEWKYIEPAKQKAGGESKPQLFNLGDDLAEEHNLAKRHPEKVKEMSSLLEEIRQSGRMP